MDKHILMTGETCGGVRWERAGGWPPPNTIPVIYVMMWRCSALIISLCFLPWKWSRSLTLSHHLGQAASLPAGHTSVGQRTGPMEQCKHNYHFIVHHTGLTPSANSYFPLTLWPNILNIYISTVTVGPPSSSDIYFLNHINKRWKNSKTF